MTSLVIGALKENVVPAEAATGSTGAGRMRGLREATVHSHLARPPVAVSLPSRGGKLEVE